MKHTEINSLYWYLFNLNTGSTIDYIGYLGMCVPVVLVIAFCALILRNRANLKPINKCEL